MIPLFLGLTAVNLLCLILTAVLGYMTSSGAHVGQWHVLAGALSAIACCAVHCIVFTYFIATAKWAQHAVAVKGLDPQLVSPTRSFKAQAMPAALLAMASVFVAAMMGAYTDSYQTSPEIHHVAAIVAIAVNALVPIAEFSAIHRNGQLIDGILAKIAQQTAQ
jgi:hypothetical protein